jgi:hypothetical protein
MIDILADELRLAIQQLHGCPSRLVERLPLSDSRHRAQIESGTVHLYELVGHPSALRCYAWAAVSKDNSTIMHAVLQSDGVNSPELAVDCVLGGGKPRAHNLSPE